MGSSNLVYRTITSLFPSFHPLYLPLAFLSTGLNLTMSRYRRGGRQINTTSLLFIFIYTELKVKLLHNYSFFGFS